MNDNHRLIVTEDGSHSIYLPQLKETYHSTHGAIQESLHVFIENGLAYLLDQQVMPPVNILEVGFGTGLNAVLTNSYAEKKCTLINYFAVEPFPLPLETVASLNYPNKELLYKLHEDQWSKKMSLTDNLNFTKYKCKWLEFTDSSTFDLVYYDAFAPSKQPNMWNDDHMAKIAQHCHHNTVLVTYCAQGAFKRKLMALGFEVTSLKGPPGKHEMVRGIFKT